jgi:hypothetical protein
MATETKKKVDFLCIYTYSEKEIHDELVLHLSGLRRLDLIGNWYDCEINAEMDRSENLNQHLEMVHFILLLISQPFLDSPFIHSLFAKYMLEKHEQRKAYVIPILVSPTEWADTPLVSLQALPANKEPVSLWYNQDEALVDIVESIHIAIKEYWAINAVNQKTRELSGGLQRALYDIDRILQEIQKLEHIAQQPPSLSYSPDDWREEIEKTLNTLRSSVSSGLDQFKQLAGE